MFMYVERLAENTWRASQRSGDVTLSVTAPTRRGAMLTLLDILAARSKGARSVQAVV